MNYPIADRYILYLKPGIIVATDSIAISCRNQLQCITNKGQLQLSDTVGYSAVTFALQVVTGCMQGSCKYNYQ